MTESLTTSRRSFITRAGAAGAALAATFGLPAGAMAGGGRNRRRIYRLAPKGSKYRCRKGAHDCSACKACKRHAKNKLFASKDAAEMEKFRAHPNCRCGVKKGRKLPRDVWQDLFHPKSGNKHMVVDKRDRRVHRILNES